MKKPDEILIRKFIENRCSEPEYRQIMEYLNSLNDSELNIFMDSHLEVISSINPGNNEHIGDVDSIIAKINPVSDKDKPVLSRRRTGYLIAASIAFLMLLSTATLYYFGAFNVKKTETIWNENTTEMGQKFSLSLPDGTNIILNGDGKIKFPQKFDQSTRDIYLEGEAYFEVAHDSSKPFIVHTGNISTIVMGTKFNISAFSNEKEIAVSLVEGKVKVANDDPHNIKGSIVLEPNQRLVFDKEKEENKIENFDVQKTTGWKENILIFDKEPLSKIFPVLERAYGVKYELADKSSSSLQITANFNKASLWTVNESIKKLTDLQYKLEKENNKIKKVIFYKKTIKAK